MTRRRPSACFLIAAVPIAIGLASRPASGQSRGLGPLAYEEQSPLQRVSFTPMTEGADPIPRGWFSASLQMGYSNIFEHDSTENHSLFLDMEQLLTSTTLRYGLSDAWEVGGRLTFETSGGGILDSFLSRYHHALGVGDADRTSYPFNAFKAELTDGSGRVRLEMARHGMTLDNVRLFAKWRALGSKGGRRVLSLRAVGEIPGDQNPIGRKRANVALMALGRMSWTRYHLHGMLSASTVRVSPELRELVRSYALFFMVAGERVLTPSLSAVAELTAATARMRGFGDEKVDGKPINLVLGFAGRAGQAWRWGLSFQEDTPPDRPSVDFTAGIRISRTW